MASLINRDSFISTGTETKTYESKRGDWTTTYETGSVEVTLQRQTKRIEARRYEDGSICVNALTGRYQQGGKAWPASLTSYANKSDYVWFGRDDRSGRFNKANGLYFA